MHSTWCARSSRSLCAALVLGACAVSSAVDSNTAAAVHLGLLPNYTDPYATGRVAVTSTLAREFTMLYADTAFAGAGVNVGDAIRAIWFRGGVALVIPMPNGNLTLDNFVIRVARAHGPAYNSTHGNVNEMVAGPWTVLLNTTLHVENASIPQMPDSSTFVPFSLRIAFESDWVYEGGSFLLQLKQGACTGCPSILVESMPHTSALLAHVSSRATVTVRSGTNVPMMQIEIVPPPSPTPSVTPSATPSVTPSASPSGSPTSTGSNTPSPTGTRSPSGAPTSTSTRSPSGAPTSTSTLSPTSSRTPSSTWSASALPSSSASLPPMSVVVGMSLTLALPDVTPAQLVSNTALMCELQASLAFSLNVPASAVRFTSVTSVDGSADAGADATLTSPHGLVNCGGYESATAAAAAAAAAGAHVSGGRVLPAAARALVLTPGSGLQVDVQVVVPTVSVALTVARQVRTSSPSSLLSTFLSSSAALAANLSTSNVYVSNAVSLTTPSGDSVPIDGNTDAPRTAVVAAKALVGVVGGVAAVALVLYMLQRNGVIRITRRAQPLMTGVIVARSAAPTSPPAQSLPQPSIMAPRMHGADGLERV